MGASGVKKDALNISGANSTLAGNAASTINPIYAQEATSPTGYTPQQRANQLTASSQALGGGMASAVGQGNLMAARTNNAGGSNLALDDAARNASAKQSENALGVENDNAQLMEKQKQEGLAGLNSIYGTGTNASISALNTANNVQPSFWKTAILQMMKNGEQAAAAGAGGA